MKIICDSSTLILLAKTELLDLVCQMVDFVITNIVEKECTIKKDIYDSQLISHFIENKKIKVVQVETSINQRRLEKDFRLASGETSSILVAQAKKLPLAVDDGQTIKVCKILNIKFITAIHFLIAIYEKRKIDTELAMVKLQQLKKFGRYNTKIISDAINKIRR